MYRKKRTRPKKIHKLFVALLPFFAVVFFCGYQQYKPQIKSTLLSCINALPSQTIVAEPHTHSPTAPEPSSPRFTYKITKAQYDNLSFGIPGVADSIIEREGYALGYIEKHEQAAWVSYVMTAEEVSGNRQTRSNNFRADPAVPSGSASPQDYTRSGYDRGHLAPAADMAFSSQTMSESFYMSNMSPQAPKFNRGIWKELETLIRHFAFREKKIVVVTGPILSDSSTSITIGSNKVTVPQFYYKVIYDTTPPEKMIGFVLPNKGSNADLRTFVVTVDRVEELTGLNFFSEIPQPQQEKLESTISVNSWDWIK